MWEVSSRSCEMLRQLCSTRGVSDRANERVVELGLTGPSVDYGPPEPYFDRSWKLGDVTPT